MSGLINTMPGAAARQWGAACSSGAHSFAAARVARIVLQREPMASEALSWSTLYTCQPDPVRGRAELALCLLHRPEMAELDDANRIARAYNAVFDRYDSSRAPDLAYWVSQLAAGQSLETLVRKQLVPLWESGYRAAACAAPVAARRPLFAVRDSAGLPLVFSLAANGRLYMYRRTPFGCWSQTNLSARLPQGGKRQVQCADIRQAPDGTIAVALALEPGGEDTAATLHVAVGISNALDEAGWVELFAGMEGRSAGPVGPLVSQIAFGLLQSGAAPLVLVDGESCWYFNAAAGGALSLVELRDGPLPSWGCAIGSYRVPGAWMLQDAAQGRALRFEAFAAPAGRSTQMDYTGLPRRAASVYLAASALPNVPDVFVAGEGIVVYRGGQLAPQPVVNVSGAHLVWSESGPSGEYLAYGDASGELWLVMRAPGEAWSKPVAVAGSLVTTALLGTALYGGVHAIGITPGGALAWLRLNAHGAQVGAEEITQYAVWEQEAEDLEALAGPVAA
jgi:hypothetical protein